jgi:ornithine carbamoyltransferase
MKRDFLSLNDLSPVELGQLVEEAYSLKESLNSGEQEPLLAGRILAMIFHKPSLRTRVSFEAGTRKLGGGAILIRDEEIGMETRESIKDIGRVLGRFVDAIMIRTFKQELVEELAADCPVPVINGLTDKYHPCQILGDLLTVREQIGRLVDFKLVYLGDGNNVANSWLNASILLPMDLALVCPEGYEPDAGLLQEAQDKSSGTVELFHEPAEALRNADFIYTDVWASMGQESEAAEREAAMRRLQVNSELLEMAPKSARVLHCLPAHRGQEITDEVMDGPQAVVYDQAENRMHAQMALLLFLLAAS